MHYTSNLSINIDIANKIFHDQITVSTNPAVKKVLEEKPNPKKVNYPYEHTGYK